MGPEECVSSMHQCCSQMDLVWVVHSCDLSWCEFMSVTRCHIKNMSPRSALPHLPILLFFHSFLLNGIPLTILMACLIKNTVFEVQFFLLYSLLLSLKNKQRVQMWILSFYFFLKNNTVIKIYRTQDSNVNKVILEMIWGLYYIPFRTP